MVVSDSMPKQCNDRLGAAPVKKGFADPLALRMLADGAFAGMALDGGEFGESFWSRASVSAEVAEDAQAGLPVPRDLRRDLDLGRGFGAGWLARSASTAGSAGDLGARLTPRESASCCTASFREMGLRESWYAGSGLSESRRASESGRGP